MKFLFLFNAAVFAFLMLFVGCNANSEPSDRDYDGPPPPPPSCEGFQEMEPNDMHSMANFVSHLPVLQGEEVCGTWIYQNDGPAGKDYYHFYLNPKPGVEEIKLNLVLECEETTVPVAYLSQTVYDQEGYPTGYNNIGTLYGVHGELIILDFSIPYDFLEKNDLFIRLDGIYPKDFIVKDYEFKYWNY